MTGNRHLQTIPVNPGVRKGRPSLLERALPGFAIISGWCLLGTVLFVACSPPAFRLQGDAPPGVSRVALLDSTAIELVDSLWTEAARQKVDLEADRKAALDSLEAKGEGLQAPLAEARRRLSRARKRYADIFGHTTRYLSFGGNPVFTKEDSRASTDDLLEAIADKIHRGKAFSLETERALRSHIRGRLKPLEAEVRRAAAAVRKVRGSGSQTEKETERVKVEFDAAARALTDRFNAAVREGIASRVQVEAAADSAGEFRFLKIGIGSYHIYAPGPQPQAWMEPVQVRGHTQISLLPHRMRTILIGDEG